MKTIIFILVLVSSSFAQALNDSLKTFGTVAEDSLYFYSLVNKAAKAEFKLDMLKSDYNQLLAQYYMMYRVVNDLVTPFGKDKCFPDSTLRIKRDMLRDICGFEPAGMTWDELLNKYFIRETKTHSY